MIRARRRARELPRFTAGNASPGPVYDQRDIGCTSDDRPAREWSAPTPGGSFGSFLGGSVMSVKLAIVVVTAAVFTAGCDQQALKVAQARADSLQNVAADHDRSEER